MEKWNEAGAVNEVGALLEVAAEMMERLGITPAESLHRAIARRVWTSLGPLAMPTRTVHDGIAGAVYTGLRMGTRTAASAAAATARAAGRGRSVRPLNATSRGRLVVGLLNAVIGDRLADQGNHLAIAMSIRQRGMDVRTGRAALAKAFPKATSRVVVFLHGLGENEEHWRPGRAFSFGSRLRADLGLTPVHVRYNSGRHVSDNGDLLAQLLEDLVGRWPVEVEELALVGHSMGGLVARSACHAALQGGRVWPLRLRYLVTLGTPHTGAPLPKAVQAAAWVLRKVPEARPLAEVLDNRSAGIRDLTHGYLLEADWRLEDPDRLLDDQRGMVTPTPGCTHTFITATLTRDPSSPLGRLAGDLLVRTDSAGGRHRTRPIPIPTESVVHLGSMTHFDLLGHGLVYKHLKHALEEIPSRRPK